MGGSVRFKYFQYASCRDATVFFPTLYPSLLIVYAMCGYQILSCVYGVLGGRYVMCACSQCFGHASCGWLSITFSMKKVGMPWLLCTHSHQLLKLRKVCQFLNGSGGARVSFLFPIFWYCFRSTLFKHFQYDSCGFAISLFPALYPHPPLCAICKVCV